jgi:hypothetical protein
MIKIGKPVIRRTDEKIFLQAKIVDEVQGIDDYLWFSSDTVYGEYFCDEVADAFLLGLLLPALRTGQDIAVNALISEKLWYNINHSLLYTFHISYGQRMINVTCKGTMVPEYNAHGVGCGCSLGVDSFAAILSHTSDDCPEHYRITHLTYFNVGAHGYKNLEATHNSYLKDLEMIRAFAAKMSLPVVCIDSNLHIMYAGFDFDQSGDTRNMTAVLSMQKLFGKYLYGSSYPIKEFKFTPVQSGYYETLLLPLMSTENTELVVANADMSRVDKTRFIADNPLVQQTLYVCWKELIVNNNPDSPIAKIQDAKLNCTRCDKCLRTVLTLDIIGKVSLFADIFDLEYWYKHKNAYIARIMYMKKHDAFYSDIYQLMRETHYKIPVSARMRLLYLKVMSVPYRLKKFVLKSKI